MSSWGYSCSYDNCQAVAVAAADWPAHVQNAHTVVGDLNATQMKRAAATAQRTAVANAPNNYAAPVATRTKVSRVDASYSLLAINRTVVDAADYSGLITDGRLEPGFVSGWISLVEKEIVPTGNIDIASFLMTLYVHLLITDAGEDSALSGSFAAVITSPAAGTRQTLWRVVFSRLKAHGKSHGVPNATPRMVARFYAPEIYRLLHAPNNPVNDLHDELPSWAQKYSTSKSWWAACSFFEAMVKPSERTEEEVALLKAHQEAIVKSPSTHGTSEYKLTFDAGTNRTPHGRLNRAMIDLGVDAARRGDLKTLMQLKTITST